MYTHHTYTRILFSHKKEGNLAICNNMEAPDGILLSEISEKKTYHMISLLCGITTKLQVYRYREQIGGCQRQEVEGWAKWVKGVKRHKLPAMK